LPAVPGGRPARSAGRHQCRLPPPRQRRWRARGHRPGPPRARPCRPSPPAGPGRPPAPPPNPAAGPFLFPAVLRPVAPRGCRPPPARRGPDLTRRAKRSVRRRGPTDGPPPGTVTAPGRPPATPDADPGTPADPLLTIEEVTAELRVSRAAFYRWRRQRAGPPVVRLPGGGVRVRHSALTTWLRHLEDTQDGQEQTADGQLRHQVLGHQEARQRHRSPLPGPVGGRRARALQVVQGPPPSPTGSSTASRTRSATGGPSTPATACPKPRPPGTSW